MMMSDDSSSEGTEISALYVLEMAKAIGRISMEPVSIVMIAAQMPPRCYSRTGRDGYVNRPYLNGTNATSILMYADCSSIATEILLWRYF